MNMQQHLKQLMMTLALLVTAATSAWAADVLNLVVNGTSATIMYDGNASNNPILGERGWEQNGDDWDMEYSTRATITTLRFSSSSCSAISRAPMPVLASSSARSHKIPLPIAAEQLSTT